jgi:hypothetical protein
MEIRTVKEMHGESNGKPWTRYEFEMDDLKKYSSFDKGLFENFKAGDNVEIQGFQDGKFFKLEGFVKVERVKESDTEKPKEKPRAMRCSTEISSTEFIRYSIKLYDCEGFKGDFNEAQEWIFNAYKNFLGKLESL